MFESIILTGPRDDGSDTVVHINQPSPIISKAVNSWPWNQALSKIKRPTIIPIHELSINALHQMSLSAFCISWNTCALQNMTYERMLEQEIFDNRNITLVKRIWSCKIWDEDELQQKYIFLIVSNQLSLLRLKLNQVNKWSTCVTFLVPIK